MTKIPFIAANINKNIAPKAFIIIDKAPSKNENPKIIKAITKIINKIFNTCITTFNEINI